MRLNQLALLMISVMLLCLGTLTQAQTQLVTLKENVKLTDVLPLTSPAALAWRQTHPQLKIAIWQPAQPPFEMDYLPRKTLEGLTADYVTLIGHVLGVQVQVLRYSDSASALSALQRGEVDLLPSYPLFANQAAVQLSIPYIYDHAVLIQQKPSPRTAGSTLLYSGNETVAQHLQQRWPQAKLTRQDNGFLAMDAVRSDANTMQWSSAIAAHSLNQRIFRSRLNISDIGESMNRTFVSVKDNTPLIALINQAIRSIPLATLNQLAQRWDLPLQAVVHQTESALTANEQQWIAQHPILTVFIDSNSAPLAAMDEKGDAAGIVIDLLKNLAAHTGLQLRFEHEDNLASMRKKLLQEPDSLIAVADASAQQDANIHYSNAYFTSPWVLMTKSSLPAITSLTAMNGKRIAVYPGAYYLPELKRHFPKVDFVETPMSLKSLLQLTSGQIEGAIVPQVVANMFEQTLLENVFRIALVLDQKPLRMAMAVNTSNAALLPLLNKSIDNLPPRDMVSKLLQWHKNLPLSALTRWDEYKYSVYSVMVIALMILGFFLLRHLTLRKNLAAREKLQAELEQAKHEAEQANASKSIFLAQMSHEIRTPMNALIGLLELENTGRSAPEQRKNNIAAAYESSKSLLLLVGDILDLAKIESGTLTVRNIPVSLSEILNSISTLFRHSAEAKGLSLLTSLEVTHQTIRFDPVMLRQIISNLLSNAIKFTQHGQVEVAIYQAEEGSDKSKQDYVLEVCDSGIGLSEDQQRVIFEPFVQAEQGAVQFKGTGLGLSICLHLATILGGTLRVESELGEGTTFLFRFSAEICDDASLRAETILPSLATQPKRILLVDDHAPNRFLLSQQLAFAGHHSVAVEGGEQALQAWQQSPFDAVITDCNMPGISGFELVRQLRELEKRRGTEPMMMFGLTAMAEQDVTIRARAAGMTDCLFKPIELAQLLARLDNSTRTPLLSYDTQRSILTLEKLGRANPAAFNELVKMVIEQNQQDLARVDSAIGRQDYAELRRAAHAIHGGARILDSSALMEVSAALELAAKERDITSILILQERCHVSINQLEKELLKAVKINKRMKLI